MERREFMLLVAAAVLGSSAELAFAQLEAKTQAYEVWKANRLVLTVSDAPGPLVSTALAPPGSARVSHPFLSGSAHVAEEEPALREILEQAKNFPDFVARLLRAGYTLRERTLAGSTR
jgi:hypothetical protein